MLSSQLTDFVTAVTAVLPIIVIVAIIFGAAWAGGWAIWTAKTRTPRRNPYAVSRKTEAGRKDLHNRAWGGRR